MERIQAMKGVLFDFNGTMFLDTPLHFRAWKVFIREQLGREFSDSDRELLLRISNNRSILPHLFPGKTEAEILVLSEKKEAEYREQCRKAPELFHLTPGLEDLLDRWTARGIPMAIATCACKSNVEFYFEEMGLRRWFPRERVVCDGENVPGKPDPTIYRLAAESIGIKPEDCCVFEDSPHGFLAARNAGVQEIYAVTGSFSREELEKNPLVTRVLDDFRNFDL